MSKLPPKDSYACMLAREGHTNIRMRKQALAQEVKALGADPRASRPKTKKMLKARAKLSTRQRKIAERMSGPDHAYTGYRYRPLSKLQRQYILAVCESLYNDRDY